MWLGNVKFKFKFVKLEKFIVLFDDVGVLVL